MTDFKELREALDAGPTDGPWTADDNEGFGALKIWAGCAPSGNSSTPGKIVATIDEMTRECEENARFITAANPAVIRSLLAELDAARKDAERWRTFIGLGYEIRAEWAANLSLAPVLTSWVDAAMKEQQP